MILELIRLENHPKFGTFGVLKIDKRVFCCTLELPWRMNEMGKSCIPVGQYVAKRHNSPKFGDTFWLRNVPGRTHILIHSGNRVRDTAGCILLGQYFGKLKGDPAVLNSGRTFSSFMLLSTGMHEVGLTIRDCF